MIHVHSWKIFINIFIPSHQTLCKGITNTDHTKTDHKQKKMVETDQNKNWLHEMLSLFSKLFFFLL